jgi:hypothetical protein
MNKDVGRLGYKKCQVPKAWRALLGQGLWRYEWLGWMNDNGCKGDATKCH